MLKNRGSYYCIWFFPPQTLAVLRYDWFLLSDSLLLFWLCFHLLCVTLKEKLLSSVNPSVSRALFYLFILYILDLFFLFLKKWLYLYYFLLYCCFFIIYFGVGGLCLTMYHIVLPSCWWHLWLIPSSFSEDTSIVAWGYS